MIDFGKIKEAAARHERTHSSAEDLRHLADAVPDLLAAIERLTETLADANARIVKRDAEIERLRAIKSTRVATIDLRVEGAAELQAASEAIERLTAPVDLEATTIAAWMSSGKDTLDAWADIGEPARESWREMVRAVLTFAGKVTR